MDFSIVRVYPCPSVASLTKPLICQGLLAEWTAAVGVTVSKAESQGTIRHYCPKLARNLPILAFTNAVETPLVTKLARFIIRHRVAFESHALMQNPYD
jgi:hypothetical protein